MLERVSRFRNGSFTVLRCAPAAQDDRMGEGPIADMQESEVPQYFIYIVTNKNKTVLYTGVTNSPVRRIWQHKNKAFPGFTKKYNCDRLIFFEVYERIEQAIVREKQIKGWTRAKKNALIFPTNPRWEDLAASWFDDERNGSFAVFAAQDDRGDMK
ncbi:MAG TPA: GIY-YIG nuclease family protein [Thermoanaerobaculia bacterium]